MSRQALKRTSPLRFTTGKSLGTFIGIYPHTLWKSPSYLSVYLTMFSRDRSLLARKALNMPRMPALVAWRKRYTRGIIHTFVQFQLVEE